MSVSFGSDNYIARLRGVLAHGWNTFGGESDIPYFERKREGRSFLEEDWDTVFILDACRYDTYRRYNHLEGNLSKRVSHGSSSIEFLEENFGDGQFHDVVYVSANPYISRLSPETFHAVVPVYEQWDDALQTVTPMVMNDAVRDAHETYPHKRIIAHYMQPHYPFIGETGRRIDHRGYAPDGDYGAMESLSIWTQLQFGLTTATKEEVITAYEENLVLVLEAIQNLLPAIDGKSALTADHGNLLGERPWPIPFHVYGHYRGLATPELVHVPWFELPFEERRETFSDPPIGRTINIEDDVIKKRFRDLGYYE